MPKIELHAHLSGSISCNTVEKLVTLHKFNYPEEELPPEAEQFKDKTETNSSFDATYEIFTIAQRIVDHPDAVKLATKRVIEDFSDENVKFLELRSTPRHVPGKMTKEEYIEAVVSTMRECSENLPIIVKYLVSIDRRGSVEAAEEALELCLAMHSKYPDTVVGLDLSGDARVNDLLDFLPVLKSAASAGLFVTLHLAEVPNAAEIKSVLSDFRPHRIGHGTSIHPKFGGEQTLWSMFSSLQPPIPVEICLTSNMICRTGEDLSHHVEELHQSGLPFVLCTDDRGVFNCSLTFEYERAKKILQLSNVDMFRLSEKSIDFAFASDEEKETLRRMWKTWAEENCRA